MTPGHPLKFRQAQQSGIRVFHRFAGSGNAQFLLEVSRWAFHERSSLRASNLRHHPPGQREQPDLYRITDEIEFELDVHEFNGGRWQPYKCAPHDFHLVVSIWSDELPTSVEQLSLELRIGPGLQWRLCRCEAGI